VSAALGGEAGRQAAEATLAEATVRAEAAAMLRRRLLFAHASHVVDSLAVRGPAREARGRARRPRQDSGTRHSRFYTAGGGLCTRSHAASS
jgi:hypothetical protein